MTILPGLKRFQKALSPFTEFRSKPFTAQKISTAEHHRLHKLLALVNEKSQPNINELALLTQKIDILALNVKAMGYELARQLGTLYPAAALTEVQQVSLASKMSTQSDMESAWLRHWCAELKVPVMFHRKLWENGYLLQALFNGGHLTAQGRGLGFGCGIEPTPSYLAAHGIAVTVTDLPPDDTRAKAWADTGQLAGEAIEHTRAQHLVDRETFERHVTLRYVDMNAIPDDLVDYDFCWSICALEHLGSIQKGLDFIENSLKTIRGGGTAIHTMEFNINPEGPTIDNWPTVFFQRRHVEQLAAKLTAAGHHVAPFDFDPGSKPLDQFIDLPPWNNGAKQKLSEWLGQPHHLKISADGFVATCFGIIITKAGAPAAA